MSQSRRHDSMVRRSVTLLREALRDNDEDSTAGPTTAALLLPPTPYGAFVAIVVSESLLSVLVFRRGTWKQHAA